MAEGRGGGTALQLLGLLAIVSDASGTEVRCTTARGLASLEAARSVLSAVEPYASRGARTVVRPGKAGVFRRSQSCRGNNRKPRSWEGRPEGNRRP